MSPVTLDYPVTITHRYMSYVTPMLHVTRDRLTCDGGAH
jgi:hypothetical protein